MAKISMKALLESGVHFGHRTHRWNPNMRPYIFTARNGIHILDLQQTVKALSEAYKIVNDLVAKGGTVLFVGTKRQAVETIEEEAARCGMPYVTVRWLGGMLTNWKTMRERISELERLERMRERGDFERLTKKEGLMLTRKIEKLEARFGGIRDMHGLPEMVFVVDVRREDTAVKEANTLGIPVVALVDTNADPFTVDHVIPSNDDAIRAIKLLVGHMADAVIEGRALRDDDDDFIPPTLEEEDIKTIDEVSDTELLGEATLKKMAEAEVIEAEAAAAEAAALAKKQAEAAADSEDGKGDEIEAKSDNAETDAKDEEEAEAEADNADTDAKDGEEDETVADNDDTDAKDEEEAETEADNADTDTKDQDKNDAKDSDAENEKDEKEEE